MAVKKLNRNPFITPKPEEMRRAYREAQVYTENYFWDFERRERAVNNYPLPTILPATRKRLPDVNDGTLAALVNAKATRLFRKMPTAKVETGSPFADIVFEDQLNNKIVPKCNVPHPAIKKVHEITRNMLTYGNQVVFTYYQNDEYWRGYSGPNFRVKPIREVYLPDGCLSIADSNVIFEDDYMPESEAKKLILQLRKDPEARKLNKGWRLKALKDSLETLTSRSFDYGSTSLEDENFSNRYVHLIGIYQRGIRSYFYSINATSGEIVRRWTNPDPRGDIPHDQCFYNVSSYNPMGIGPVQFAAPLQTFLDALLNVVLFVTAYNTNPHALSRGYSKPAKPIQFEMGGYQHISDPEFKYDFYPISTPAIDNFPVFADLLKSQILLLSQSSASHVASGVSNPGASQTPQGVDFQAQERQNEDSHIRESIERLLGDVYETMINYKIGIEKGRQKIKVDKDTRNRLLQLPNLKEATRRRLIKTDEVILNLDDFKEEGVRVHIDLGSSDQVDSARQQLKLERLIELMGGYEPLQRVLKDDVVAKNLIYSMELPQPDSYLTQIAREGNLEEFQELTAETLELVEQVLEKFLQENNMLATEADMLKSMAAIADKVSEPQFNELMQRWLKIKPGEGLSRSQQAINTEKSKILAGEGGDKQEVKSLLLRTSQPQPQTPFAQRLIEQARAGVPPAQGIANAIAPPGGPTGPTDLPPPPGAGPGPEAVV